jgi:hypothetical protein
MKLTTPPRHRSLARHSDAYLQPQNWVKAEEDLLRSLVRMSDLGDDHHDPPLAWAEIASKMNGVY